MPLIPPPQGGYLFLDKAKFHASFAADVDEDRAAFMADSQVPWGIEALSGAISVPAWKTKPSGYLVATEDRMLPPAAQRVMAKRAGSTVVEARGVTRSTSRSPERWPRSSRPLPRACDRGRPLGCPGASPTPV